jgi:hypothetical protein
MDLLVPCVIFINFIKYEWIIITDSDKKKCYGKSTINFNLPTDLIYVNINSSLFYKKAKSNSNDFLKMPPAHPTKKKCMAQNKGLIKIYNLNSKHFSVCEYLRKYEEK